MNGSASVRRVLEQTYGGTRLLAGHAPDGAPANDRGRPDRAARRGEIEQLGADYPETIAADVIRRSFAPDTLAGALRTHAPADIGPACGEAGGRIRARCGS